MAATSLQFGYVLREVLEDKKLTRNAKKVYCFLCVFADSYTWRCHPTTNLMHVCLRISSKTIRKSLKQLRSVGYIQYYDRTSNYRVVVNEKITAGKGNHTGYSVLRKSSMLHKTLSPNSKLLYAYLASFSGVSGVAWPSVALVEDRLSYSNTDFQGCKAELVMAKVIQVHHNYNGRTNSNNTYYLLENQRIQGFSVEENAGKSIEEIKKERLKRLKQTSLHTDDYYHLLYRADMTPKQQQLVAPFIRTYGELWVNSAFQYAVENYGMFPYALSMMRFWQKSQFSTDDVRTWLIEQKVNKHDQTPQLTGLDMESELPF